MAIAVMLAAVILGMYLFPVKAEAAPDPPKMLFYTVDKKTCNVTVKYEGLGDATMYSLERRDATGKFSSVDYQEVYSNKIITRTLTDKFNYPGMKNVYRLAAWKVNGGESYSDTFIVKTPLSVPVCDKSACKASSGRVKLVWSKVSMAKYYKVSRSLKKNGKYRIVKKTDRLYFYDEGLKANTVYYYKITAVSSAGVSSKAAVLKKKTAGKAKSYSSKAALPDPQSFAGIKGGTASVLANGQKYKKRTYKKVTQGMWEDYRKLLCSKKYQLAPVVSSNTVCSFDYTGKKKITHGASLAYSDKSVPADLLLSYDSAKDLMILYYPTSFQLSKVGKKECYKKKPDSTDVKYNPKTMNWCSHCTHTGKEKCMSCSGTGKKKTIVYNQSKRIYEYVDGACPFCRNGYTTCISCQGRGWNWK